MNDIEQLLPKDFYDAVIGAAAPSAGNVFATIADVTGAAQTLQDTMDLGSTASGLTTQVLIDTTIEISLLADDALTQGQIYISPAVSGIAKSNGADVNSFFMSDAATTFTDDITSKGIVYAADYSVAGILDDRWIPDYGAVKSYVLANAGIYGGDGSLVAGTTNVTMAATDVLQFDSLNGPLDGLFTIDAVNNRIGFGTATPGYGIHSKLGDLFIENGTIAVGTTTPAGGQLLKIATDNSYLTGGLIEGARVDLNHTTGIVGNFWGVDVRHGQAHGTAGVSQTFMYDANYTGSSATAGIHTNYGVRSRATMTAAGGTVTNIAGYFEAANGTTNIAMQIVGVGEGVDKVLRSDASGIATWVDPNSLIVAPTLQSTITAGSTYTGGATIDINTTDELAIKSTDGSNQAYVSLFGLTTSAEMGVIDVGGGQQFIMDLTAITISDPQNSKGAVYGADYDTNGVLDDNWIPSYRAVKAYADAAAAASDTLQEVMSNGSTATVSTNIDMTSAGGFGKLLSLNGNDFVSFSQFTTTVGAANVATALMEAQDSLAASSNISIGSTTGMVVTDNIGSIGLVYAADYSGAYTARSLVDKAYVDAQFATGATYTPTNVVTDRAYDANLTSLNELADVVGTLIADLQGVGILS